MDRSTRGAHAVAVTAAALVLLPAGLAHGAEEVVDLDLRESQTVGDVHAGPALSRQTFSSLSLLRVTVSGTGSVWLNRNWTNPRFKVCGAPQAGPEYPSPNIPNGPTGVDADGRFALVQASPQCPPLPAADDNFQVSLDAGRTWAKPEWGLFGADPLTHTYTFWARGTGAQLAARYYDPAAADNYGRLRMEIRPVVFVNAGI